jgi:hypothetical protein
MLHSSPAQHMIREVFEFRASALHDHHFEAAAPEAR